MKRHRLLPLLILLPAFALHCRQDEIRANSDPPPIEIKATVQPSQSMTISAQIDGQVESVAVREGTTISAGAPLVQLTNPIVERDAAFSRAQLDWIDARLRRGGRPAPATSARPRDSFEITAKILQLRQQRLEKMKQLRKTNDVTSRDLEQAEIEYLAALRDYNNERRTIVSGAAAADDTELLRIERQKLTAEGRFAAQRQSLLRITSPISGIVRRLHVTQGQAVFPRDPIADVANVATMHVRGNVAPELLRYIRPGMRVDVKVLSVPPRAFADEVEYVIPVQGTGPESRNATVIVTVPNPDGSLQPNSDALITFRSIR